jgi:hypothetical protein
VDDVCFIADSSLAVGNYPNHEYEWQFWDNIPARVFAEIQDELWFGTDDGRLCKFDTDHTDRTFEVIAPGDMSFQPADDNVVYGVGVEVEDGQKLIFANETLFEVVFDKSVVYSISGNTITIQDMDSPGIWENIFLLNEGDEFTLIGDDEEVSYGVYVSNINVGTMTFDLLGILDDLPVDLETIAIDQIFLIKEMKETELYIDNVDTVEQTFQLKRYMDGNPLSFIVYSGAELDNATETNIAVLVITTTNVASTWLSPYLNLGTDVYAKTLLSLTISTPPQAEGSLSVGYETRNFILDSAVEGLTLASLEDLSLNSFSLASVAVSYTKKVKERNFNYIYFWFISDDEYACSINSLTVRFVYNQLNRGAR